jgi:soluble lytic murein transglycosylase
MTTIRNVFQHSAKTLLRAFCLAVALAAVWGRVQAAELVPAPLRDLAAHATSHAVWPRLRNYAQAQGDTEWCGWAYFLAGYQEYQGQQFPQAARDLAQAAQSPFPLADYAVFYQASALSRSHRPQNAAEVLRDFSTRFPQSFLRNQALELRASALLDASQGQQAIDALAAAPETRQQPALALLLARAYFETQHGVEAATAFQEVYGNFPLSSEAPAAAYWLRQLRARLGTHYPRPAPTLETTRVEVLFKAAHYREALRGYEELLKSEPANSLAPRWRLGQAECLLHQRRSVEALQVLFNHFDSSDQEAQRLELLVQAHAQQSDTQAMSHDLAQLDSSHASSPAYADALSAAGMFYYRQLDWREAARHYRRLWELFPHSDHLRADGWRLAWCDYLLQDAATPDVMRDYLLRFPDAPRVPGALYWLGRIEEEHGATAEARALYALLVKRFAHSYYIPQASARLAALRAGAGALATASDSPPAPLAAALIPVLAPPVIPQGLACFACDVAPVPPTAGPACAAPSLLSGQAPKGGATRAPSDAARPAMILHSLQLKSLEEDYLKAALTANPTGVGAADLHLLLARMAADEDDAAGALFSVMKITPAYAHLEFSDLPEEVWYFLYPRAYWKLIERQARLSNVDPYLVMGLVRQESAFNARAVSVADARGLMQILPETAARSSRAARQRSVGRRLFDPAYNVRFGCTYLAGLLKEFGNRPELALAAYNAGESRVKDWLQKSSSHESAMFTESIPIPATRTYVELVLRDAEIYRQLMGGSPHFAQCASEVRGPGSEVRSPREPLPETDALRLRAAK